MKEVQSGGIAPDHFYARVGEIAIIQTDDGMKYIFKKPTWSEEWKFSHRGIWEAETGFRGNPDNRPLPEAVEEWADANLGDWEFADGYVSYSQEEKHRHIVVEERRDD